MTAKHNSPYPMPKRHQVSGEGMMLELLLKAVEDCRSRDQGGDSDESERAKHLAEAYVHAKTEHARIVIARFAGENLRDDDYFEFVRLGGVD